MGWRRGGFFDFVRQEDGKAACEYIGNGVKAVFYSLSLIQQRIDRHVERAELETLDGLVTAACQRAELRAVRELHAAGYHWSKVHGKWRRKSGKGEAKGD